MGLHQVYYYLASSATKLVTSQLFARFGENILYDSSSLTENRASKTPDGKNQSRVHTYFDNMLCHASFSSVVLEKIKIKQLSITYFLKMLNYTVKGKDNEEVDNATVGKCSKHRHTKRNNLNDIRKLC